MTGAPAAAMSAYPCAASAAWRATSAASRAKLAAAWGLIVAMGVPPSDGGFRQEVRMDHGAVAGENGRLDDGVVEVHRECLGLLVDQDFQECIEVPGIEARSGGGEPAGIAVADDLDAVDLGE